MALKEYLFGIIVIAGLMTGIVLFISEANNFYGFTTTSENVDFYNKINTTSKSTSSFTAGWRSNTTQPSFIGSIFQFGAGLANSILSIFKAGDATVSLIDYGGERVTRALPQTVWIFVIAGTLLVAFLTYVVITIMTGRNA